MGVIVIPPVIQVTLSQVIKPKTKIKQDLTSFLGMIE
jgi:hypothetical protein